MNSRNSKKKTWLNWATNFFLTPSVICLGKELWYRECKSQIWKTVEIEFCCSRARVGRERASWRPRLCCRCCCFHPSMNCSCSSFNSATAACSSSSLPPPHASTCSFHKKSFHSSVLSCPTENFTILSQDKWMQGCTRNDDSCSSSYEMFGRVLSFFSFSLMQKQMEMKIKKSVLPRGGKILKTRKNSNYSAFFPRRALLWILFLFCWHFNLTPFVMFVDLAKSRHNSTGERKAWISNFCVVFGCMHKFNDFLYRFTIPSLEGVGKNKIQFVIWARLRLHRTARTRMQSKTDYSASLIVACCLLT